MRNLVLRLAVCLTVAGWGSGCRPEAPPAEVATDTVAVLPDAPLEEAFVADTLAYRIVTLDTVVGDCEALPCLTLSASYPQLTADSVASVRRVNQRVRALVFRGQTPAEMLTSRLPEDLSKAAAVGPWEMQRHARVLRNSADVLTVGMEAYDFFGGAHGQPFVRYLQFRPASGDTIGLSDLFQTGYRDSLTTLAERSFRERYDVPPGMTLQMAGYWFDESGFRLPGNYALLPDSLLFVYDPYDIAPYAAGMPQVSVAYTDLYGLLLADTLTVP